MRLRRPVLRLALLLPAGSAGGVAPRDAVGAQPSRPAQGEDVRYRNDTLTLAAELLVSAARGGPVPAAVVIQDFGTSDRMETAGGEHRTGVRLVRGPAANRR
jgi:hypothetical protein